MRLDSVFDWGEESKKGKNVSVLIYENSIISIT
jgi:hypothetical protein